MGPLPPGMDALVTSFRGGRFPLTFGGPNPPRLAAGLFVVAFVSTFGRVRGR